MSKILIVLFALLAFTIAAEPEVDEGVLVLTTENFDETIAKYDQILVEFYAPWCGHCKKLAPEYSKAALRLAELDPVVPLAKVDATEEKDLASRFEVKGFPTLKWFVNGEAQEYKGGRVEDEIVNWIKKRSGPPTTVVDDTKLEELKTTEKFLVVFFGSADSDEYKEFNKAASADDKHTFLHNPTGVAPEGLTAPGVVVFRQFDEPTVVHTGEATSAAISAFILNASVPTLIEFSDEFIEPIFQKQQPACFLFMDKTNAEHEKLLSVYSKAAEAGKGKILYAYSGVTDGIQQRLAEFVGVETTDMPRLMIVGFNAEGVDKFVYDGDINALSSDDVEKFVTKYQNGDLTKYLKSEEVPETQEGPVTVVVGKNFATVVGGDDDVLLEFYAPWCGHCKALEPKYDELATELADVSGLVIAKCDSTANEIDGVSISGFPTIKFFPKGSTTAVEYEGEREVDGFKKYLEENSEAYKAHQAKIDDL
jgi:protein disulfide-isomerase A1